MPINLKKLREIEKSVTVEYKGETARLKYRPGAITGELQEDIQKQDFSLASQVTGFWLVRVVTQWELLGDDGKPVPITLDIMKKLEPALLNAMRDAILEDLSPKEMSGDGSFTG